MERTTRSPRFLGSSASGAAERGYSLCVLRVILRVQEIVLQIAFVTVELDKQEACERTRTSTTSAT